MIGPTATIESRPVTISIRQTHLRWLEECCPAGAYALAVEGREGPSTRGAARGTAIHEAFSRYVAHLFRTGRQTDWDAMEGITREVLADFPELAFAEATEVRDQASNIARGFLFEPAHYYGSEESFATVLDLGDGRHVEITGRVDLLEACVPEGWARITDCKTNHVIPADSAVRTDFQLRTYAMLVLDNLPPAVQVVHGSLWLTRYNIRVPQKGEAAWTREDIEAFREHLINRLRAFLDGKLVREFVPSTWCQYCPRRRPSDCTHWRLSGAAPTITSAEKARRVAARIVAEEQRLDALKAALKEWVAAEGPVRIGSTAKAETFANWTETQTSYPFSTLEEAVSLLVEQGIIAPPSFDEMASVSKTSRAFRDLMKIAEFRSAMAEGLVEKQVTRFKHKHEGGDDE